ncbi:uncharacterized protein LOC143427457 [Xylocopa sonorina]|uniref:uncharacterized protein LOC143427457 n=1 Tax=Xylocopa sonorina TaxID=1818115 RepID=UPI00403B2758
MFFKNVRMASFCGKRIVLSQNNLLKIPRRNGYLILVPEIGEDLPGKYPLLKEDKSPEFTNITIEKCVAAMGKQSLEFEEAIKTLEKQITDVNNISAENLFKNILDPLEDMYTSLSITWGIAKTLYLGNKSLMPTNYYMSINERAKKALAAKHVSLPIYQACKAIMNNKEIKLSDEQRGVLTKALLEGRLNGLELTGRKSAELAGLKELLARNLDEYSQKVEAATNIFTFTIRDHATVRDFPEEVLKSMVRDPKRYLVGPWTVTLYSDVFDPFMEYCPDRTLRFKVWEANVIKASVLHDSTIQASSVLETIRARRIQQANILGYKTFVDLSMETKMAGSIENVYSTLDNLLATARPAQEYEIKELSTFASEHGLEDRLQVWDVAYWGRKQLNSLYEFREKDLNIYFHLPKVLTSLFDLVEMLFDIKIVESNRTDVWHKDVRFFDIFDLQQSSTDPISSFYLDPYAREDEKVRVLHDAGYMVPIQNKSKVSDMKPLAALIFNFQPPANGKPSLLSFKDLQTLFQKFGHMLHHTLTRVEYAEIAGISFTEWDAIFISDYFLEHWLFEPWYLQQMSCHLDTGEPLSLETIEILKKVKTHLAGYTLCREMYLAQFDLELYSGNDFWNTIMGRIWGKYFVLPPYKKDSHICSFQQIFSGDWAAAYYSNMWSRMIAADLHSAFQELPHADKNSLKQLGMRYRNTFLSAGGTHSAREYFRKFRGRDPSPNALLKSLQLDIKCNMLEASKEKISANLK